MIENVYRDPRQPIERNLRRISGRGKTDIVHVCRQLRRLPTTPWSYLSPGQVQLRRNLVGDALALRPRREVQQKLARERERGTVRAIRRRRGLPVRGQRTRTNGRTAKKLNRGR